MNDLQIRKALRLQSFLVAAKLAALMGACTQSSMQACTARTGLLWSVLPLDVMHASFSGTCIKRQRVCLCRLVLVSARLHLVLHKDNVKRVQQLCKW